MQLFSWLTLLQLGVGTWFLLSLPQQTLQRFMGGGTVATALLAIGILLAVATLVTGFKQQVLPTLWLTLPLVYVMSFMRDVVRGNFLAPYFNPTIVPVQVQWSPLVFFLVVLVLGVVLVIWMLLKLINVKKAS